MKKERYNNKNTEMNMYSVWCGGVEVNDYHLSYDEAYNLYMEYIEDGYDDVYIELMYRMIHYIDNGNFIYVDDDGKKHIVETLDTIDNKYYFEIYCNQNNCTMGFGSNVRTIKELLDDYFTYKSIDSNDEYDDFMEYHLGLSIEQQLNMMFEDEFELWLYTQEIMEYN